MTPMEAWRVISENMLELYKRRKTSCYKGYTDADVEAEVVCFNALRQAKNGENEWVRDTSSNFHHRYNCTACNYRLLVEPTNYCPNCGAKMKGAKE